MNTHKEALEVLQAIIDKKEVEYLTDNGWTDCLLDDTWFPLFQTGTYRVKLQTVDIWATCDADGSNIFPYASEIAARRASNTFNNRSLVNLKGEVLDAPSS